MLEPTTPQARDFDSKELRRYGCPWCSWKSEIEWESHEDFAMRIALLHLLEHFVEVVAETPKAE
jgi:hypothetical protein